MLRDGHLAYLLDEKGRKHWFRLEKGMIKVSSLGSVDGTKLLAAGDGGAVSLAGRRFVLLSPSISDRMQAVERGAQVITPKDAATILFELDLKDGDVVLEAGLGSGALSTALLHAVAPSGKVISVELRSDFGEKGRENVRRSPLHHLWELRLGDVRTLPIPEKLDAVVLDMPDPWEAVANLKRSLRGGGNLCAYVPNTNQLELTVRALRQHGFVAVRALENIQREMEVHDMGTRPSYETLGHTGYLAFGRATSE